MKQCIDLKVKAVEHLSEKHVLLSLSSDMELPDMQPGQFVELRIDTEKDTFLRRPISITFFDKRANELHLLVADAGKGTHSLVQTKVGDTINCLLPLGNSFTLSSADAGNRRLLVGGGVGVAPLLYLGKVLKEQGTDVTFLLGARSASDLLLLDEFAKYGRVLVTTEDGTMGERGFVTNHSVLSTEKFSHISCCGPKPMMKAVAVYAQKSGTPCEVSLENMMACGLGACLCCVEKTTEGNLCVCKDGPVFNINKLLWQN